MKNLYKIFALLFAMGLFIVSCDEVKLDEPQLDNEITEDNAFAAQAVGDVFASTNSGTDVGGGKSAISCGTIVYEPNNDGTYSMTITYPETGCLENGVTKFGVIIAEFSGRWTKDATVTITFDGYKVNGISLAGTITATFTGLDPFPVFTLVASNMSLTYEDGRSITWGSTRTLTMTAGFITLGDKSDDKWKISGVAEGTSRSEKTFRRVETDLLTDPECKWFVGGSIELTVEESDVYKMTFKETCGSVTFEYNGITITKTLD